jgi:hypothetical protein
MQKKKVVYGLVISMALLVLAGSLVSAGFWEFITGQAISQPTNVSVQVKGATQCKLDFVAPIANVNPNEANYQTITFEAHVFDQDGANDINRTATFANFSKSGSTTRYSTQCTYNGNLPPRGANFTCSVTMWYWDASGTWNINVGGNDIGNLSGCTNTSTTFTYNLLQAMVISPPALTWSALSVGATNQLSNNHPTVINNTGNYNGTVKLNGLNLQGDVVTSEYLGVNNFTSNNNVGTVCASGTALVNGTTTTIGSTNSNPGNISAGGNQGQEMLYYCIPTVPAVTSQTYSTTLGGSWIVSY